MSHLLMEEAKQLFPELSALRRKLHQMPEVDLELPKTQQFVEKCLDEMGVRYERIGGGVAAYIGRGEKCFLLRSDMDGLPIAEESGEVFASENGCMHACGHDMHAAILLGAAKLLKKHEGELSGIVKLFFQPGEETFRGAKKAVEEGILENPKVDAAFAAHVSGMMPVGAIVYGEYPMASVYGFRITLTGKGGHGSTPELCIDPINTGVHIYLALQELIARECPAAAEAVLTVGKFSAGYANNVIPQTAVLEGTLRTFSPQIEEKLIQRISEVAESVGVTYHTKVEIETLSHVPAVICDKELNRFFVDSVQSLDDSLKLVERYHVMGSEDFAFISQKVPSSYFALGAGVEDRSKWVAQHNPKIQFNEACLPIGAAMYAKAAMDWLNEKCK